MQDIAIQLTNVTKTYIIHHEKPTLVEKFIKREHEEFTALKAITLTIKKGEKIGIIGPNGSGKTTLLKLITGITTPSSGHIYTKGKIVSLIDLEAGFHPDLSGYNNIYLNGMLLGMQKKEIDKKLKSIIAFADIKQFIDIPMYKYSSGMILRLGFSIAVHSHPQILVIDEGFGAGDANFQKKVQKKIQEFFSKNITILICSHYPAVLEKFSTSFIYMKDGTIITNKTPISQLQKTLKKFT